MLHFIRRDATLVRRIDWWRFKDILSVFLRRIKRLGRIELVLDVALSSNLF